LDTKKNWKSLIEKSILQKLGNFLKFSRTKLGGGGGGTTLSNREKLHHKYLKLGLFTIQIITYMNRIALSKMLHKNNG
jgi:hypothetical protein